MEYLVVNVNEMRGKMSEVIKAIHRNHQDKTLLLYYMQNNTTPTISVEDVKMLFELRMSPQFIACSGSDDDIIMEIASDIGYRLGAGTGVPGCADDKYIIVSNNTSYNRLASFWRDMSNDTIKTMPLASLICVMGFGNQGDTEPVDPSQVDNIATPNDPWLEDAERKLATGY